MSLRERVNLTLQGLRVHPFSFLRSLALLLAASGTTLATPGFTTAPGVGSPSCSVWVVRNALESRQAWRDALESVARAGCDRMYLQVSGRWDAYFPSTVFPPPAAAPRGDDWADDPFGRAVEDAHARGVAVHAWVNALLAWSAETPPETDEHVYRRHPEWFVRDGRGRSMRNLDRGQLDRAGLVGEGWFLDPAREEVRTELRRFVLEVATRYPVDGIHLDYIRYPTGWTPEEGPAAVSLLVGLIRRDLGATRPAARLSAAVMPRPDVALRSFGQDWGSWIESGLVDEVAPMVYRASPREVLRTVEQWPDGTPLDRVRVGVRIDRLSPDETRQTIARLEEIGVSGVALFSHNLLLDLPVWRRSGPVAPPR